MKVGFLSILLILLWGNSSISIAGTAIDTTEIKKKVDSLNLISDGLLDTAADLFHSYGREALQLSTQIHYQKGIAGSLMSISQYYFFKRKYLKTIELLMNSASISKAIKDYKKAGNAYERVGILLITLQQYSQAENYLDQSLIYLWQTKDTSSLILLYLDFGLISQVKGDTDKAFTNFWYAYFLAKKSNHLKFQARSLKLIGTLKASFGDLNSALFYYKTALNIVIKSGYLLEIGSLYTYLAHIYQIKQDYSQAIVYNRYACSLRKKLHQSDQYISSLLNLGNDFLLSGRLDSSTYYISKGIQLIPQGELYHFQEYGYDLLHKLYIRKGQYKQALDAYYQYTIARDSASTEKTRQETAIIQSREQLLEINQKNELLEYEIQLQKLEITNKNRTTLFFITVFFIAVGVLGMFYWLYVKTRRSREVLKKLNKQLDNEIQERKQVEASLIKSEESYRFLAEHTLDLILHINERGRVVYVSPTCERMFGYTPYELKERFRPRLLMDKEFHNTTRDLYGDMVRSREPRIFTFIGIRKDGKTFWAEGVANPIFEPGSGLFKGSLIVVRDISERIKYEEQLAENAHQKELLLREIHHRVKNNFAILVGVMNMQKTSSKNPELFHLISELQMRVRTMSLVHELLYRSDNLDFIPFGTYLKQLSNIVASTFRSKRIIVDHDVDNCILNIEVALPLGLVVNELLTNSFKYAFEDQEEGIIFVKLKPNSVDESGLPVTWAMTIGDNGKGLPEGYSLDTVTTMGSQIVKLLVAQVEGTIEVSSNDGAAFRIIFKQELE